MTYIEGDMLVLVLHQQSDELFEKRDRLYRFFLGPYISAFQRDPG